MRKKLLTLGALCMVLAANAQVTTFVADKAKMSVKSDALLYNGGGFKTFGTAAVVENSGNMMVVGKSTDVFATDTPNLEGGNIVMKLTDPNTYKKYGQLYVQGFDQSNITAIVDKEYKALKHGAYQQMAIPFHGKTLDFKHNGANELDKNIVATRWTQNEVLSWRNAGVLFDSTPLTGVTGTSGANYFGGTYLSNAASYYIVGANGFEPSSKVFSVHGRPYTNGHTETLKNAGNGIDFGTNTDTANWGYTTGGNVHNFYREKYNTYVLDSWSDPWRYDGTERGDFGKNLYLFGNPYLMNIDISAIASTAKDGEVFVENLKGARIDYAGVAWDGTSGSSQSLAGETAAYISYTKVNGSDYYSMVGDINAAIIKPMSTFTLKLSSNSSTQNQTFEFDKLRTFRNVGRYSGALTPVNTLGAKSASARTSIASASQTIKQLGVYALDANGNVIDRTYYALSSHFPTGYSDNPEVQVRASTVFGTFEEKAEGGIDEQHMNSYMLFINEANDVDFKGKAIPLAIYDSNVKSLKFEIRENMQEVGADGKTMLGESFYISSYGDDAGAVAVTQGQVLPTNGVTFFSLYFGKPYVGTLSVAQPSKPSKTILVRDESDKQYKLLFDKTWKTADVTVHDASGRLVKSYDKVDTKNDLIIELNEGVNAVYVVKAVSESGSTYVQKLKK